MTSISENSIKIPHSCYPNCALNSANNLFLLRTVSPGEQLTIDYSTLYLGSGSKPGFDCSCGYNGCRGKILGFNNLPVIFQEYYLKKNAVCAEVLLAFDSKRNVNQFHSNLPEEEPFSAL